MLLKRLNQNGTSKNSDKERMKNSGNDHTDLHSTYISAYLLPSYQSNLLFINSVCYIKVDFSLKKKQYRILSHFIMLSLTIALPKIETIDYLFVQSIVIFMYSKKN